MNVNSVNSSESAREATRNSPSEKRSEATKTQRKAENDRVEISRESQEALEAESQAREEAAQVQRRANR